MARLPNVFKVLHGDSYFLSLFPASYCLFLPSPFSAHTMPRARKNTGQQKQARKTSSNLETTPDSSTENSNPSPAIPMQSRKADAVIQDQALKIKISRTNIPSDLPKEALPQAHATHGTHMTVTTLPQSDKETALLAKIAAQEGKPISL